MAELTRLLTAGAIVAGGAAAAAGCPGLAALIALPAAREGLSALSAVANEILGSTLYGKLVRSDESPLANHDLQRLVAEALCEAAGITSRTLPLLSADRRKMRRLGRLIRRDWGGLVNQAARFDVLDEKRVAAWFAYGAIDSPASSASLQSMDDWQNVVDDLCVELLGRNRQEPSAGARAHLVRSLHESFLPSLRRLVKQDFAHDGRAYAALQLDFIRILMEGVGEIRTKLSEQGVLSAAALAELRAAQETLSSRSGACFTAQDSTTRDALRSIHDETRRIADGLQQQLGEIQHALVRIENSIAQARTAEGMPPFHLPLASIGANLAGRDGDLARLHALLAPDSGSDLNACAVLGFGGVGKTRLAIEYARRKRDVFAGILYAQADTPDVLRSSVAAFSGAAVLDLRLPEDVSEALRFDAVLQWLNRRRGWLLVLDNADVPEAARAVREFVGRLTGGSVLITARYSDWGPAIPTLRLDTLPLDAARDLLLARTAGARAEAPDDAAFAVRLAREFEGLPLMLEQAASAISFEHTSLRSYLEDWTRANERCLAWYDPDGDYPKALAATWERTLRRLSPEAVAALRVASLLAPDPIPLELLARASREASRLVLSEGANEPAEHTNPLPAIGQLARYGLIRIEGDLAVVHRLVQNVVRTRIPVESLARWLELTVQELRWLLPTPRNNPDAWPVWERVRGHATELIERADQHVTNGSHRTLMADFGSFLQLRAVYPEAERLMRKAIDLEREHGGPMSREMGSLLNNFVTLLRENDRYAEAEPLMRTSLAIAEDCDPPNLSVRLSNLVVLLVETSRYAEAEPHARRSLRLAERSGPDHPDVAIRLHNLARILLIQGKLEEAERMAGRAVGIERRAHGSDDYRLAQRLELQADVMEHRREFTQERELRTEAARIYRLSFPETHPWVRDAERRLRALDRRDSR